jgi:hypothetical protein
MSKVTEAAQGQICMIRLPGICNFNPETTVAAHYRLAGTCGVGIKPPDLLCAWACSDCHNAVDGRTSTLIAYDALRLAHAEGVLRTIEAMAKMGFIHFGKSLKA